MAERDIINLTYGLVLISVGAIDHQQVRTYIAAIENAPNKIEQMRVNVDYWLPVIRKLRKEKRIPTANIITEIAENMVGLSDEELADAFAFFYDEVRINDILCTMENLK